MCHLLVAFLCLFLTGCGFTPQYKAALDTRQTDFSQVEVPPITNRHGQILHNRLTSFLGDTNHQDKRYRFDVALEIKHRPIGVERNLAVSRSEVAVKAYYTYTDLKRPHKPAVKGACQSSQYYSLSNVQIFQSISAEKNAPIRALDVIARCLADRLSILVHNSKAS